MCLKLKRTELVLGKKSVGIKSSVSGLFGEEFLVPYESIDHLAIRNVLRARSALTLVLIAYAASAFGYAELAVFLGVLSLLILFAFKRTKMLMTKGGTGIKLYVSEAEWEKLKRICK